MLRGLDWGVILFAKNISIFSLLSLYNFDGGPTGQQIDLKKFMIKFWSNTPV